MTRPKKERRKQPRAKGTAGLVVSMESGTPSADIKDISLSGISFTVDSPIEFMTQLMMTLIFPTESTPSHGSDEGVRCEGAVVRCEPADADGDRYEVAVFFRHLDETAKTAIENYVRAI